MLLSSLKRKHLQIQTKSKKRNTDETIFESCKEEKKMANIYKGTLGLIGNTPLVEVVNIE